MPITTEDFHSSLYDLLRTKGYQPIPLDSKGKTSPFYPEADIFKFSFVKDGKKYGDVWATVDNGLKLVLYYDDTVSSSPSSNTKGVDVGDSWPALLKHLKRWAQRRQLGFELKNKDHLVSDMQQREYMKKKEQLGEGYYPMGKKASYNDAIPQVKIVIQHSKQLGEGEQRFRHVEKIFVENTEGERFAVPTKKPGLAKIYARHVAEGGTPYDDRGRHLTSLIEEYSKMVGFMRATKNGEFSEAVQPVVEAGRNHFTSLRETLSKLVGHRGYHAYFDSWTPVLNEEQGDENIATLFTKQQLDPRIASCIPILSKIARVDEAKPVKELDNWADEMISETTGLEMPPPKNPKNVTYRDKKAALKHYGAELDKHRTDKEKEAALAHYKNQLEHGDEGVTEGEDDDISWMTPQQQQEFRTSYAMIKQHPEIWKQYQHYTVQDLKKEFPNQPDQELKYLMSVIQHGLDVNDPNHLMGQGRAVRTILQWKQAGKQGVAEGSDEDSGAKLLWKHYVKPALKRGDIKGPFKTTLEFENFLWHVNPPGPMADVLPDVFFNADKQKRKVILQSINNYMKEGVAEGSRDKVHLKTPKYGLADHPGRNTGVGLRTFAQTPEQDRCSKCNTLYKNHYKQGVAEGILNEDPLLIKNLTKQLYSFFTQKKLPVTIRTDWDGHAFPPPGKVFSKGEQGFDTAQSPIMILTPKTGDIIAVRYYNRTMMQIISRQYNTHVEKNKIIAVLNQWSNEIKRIIPDTMEVAFQDEDKFGFYTMLIRMKTTKKGGYVQPGAQKPAAPATGAAPTAPQQKVAETETHEGLNPQQKKVGQLGPLEKAKNISPVLGKKEKQHPFQGKLVGASESIDPELKRIKSLINKK